jgi:hypothetical protein
MSIEGEETIGQRSWLEMYGDDINHAVERIDGEYQRGQNDWISCFGTVLFRVELYVEMAHGKQTITDEKYGLARRRLEDLKARKMELAEQYSDKTATPPVELQEELLKSLDVLK